MNVLKIAWRSVQHRGLGSVLTILSMALGVMLVVGVLTVHGVVSQSFKSNSNFPYDLIIGPSGSSMQVTMNTVFYLSSPVENIPYEYYLAFCDADRRRAQLKHSVAWQTGQLRQQTGRAAARLAWAAIPGSGLGLLADDAMAVAVGELESLRIGIDQDGSMSNLVDMAIPVNLGDYLGTFRVVGTTPDFFEQMVLDIDTMEKMTFSEGRAFREYDETNQYYESVLGINVARELGLKVGDVINPVHGDPNKEGAHTHEQGFTVVGILNRTGTPHDRAAFVNLEGFYLMDGHVKPVDEALITDPIIPTVEQPESSDSPSTAMTQITERAAARIPSPLPIEQREVTSVLIRSTTIEDEDEGFASIGPGFAIQASVNEGALESVLDWTDYRPLRAKEEVQAISPVMEVTSLFENIVNPIRWILLVLTIMICVVSAISILVGIYSSMSQRRHEIAVMRALGASRTKVMVITLLESITLAMLGGLLGWVGGHALNAFASPIIECVRAYPLAFGILPRGCRFSHTSVFRGFPCLGVVT